MHLIHKYDILKLPIKKYLFMIIMVERMIVMHRGRWLVGLTGTWSFYLQRHAFFKSK